MHARTTTPPDAREATDNGDIPYLLHALRRQRWGVDHCDTDWKQPLPAHAAVHLARVHRKATAIDALAGLLLANFETRTAVDDESRLDDCMTEGLFLALNELTADVHNMLGVMSEQLADTNKGDAA
ncbi:MAG: hypothetical protein IT472_11490 [Thermomonas sp.]|uniref:hypothetical protein n=1 Tax=Thermomonas sp. TaxID=1971895 RepID=UPI002634C26D|nr:hypothetical protein [Thermomonas sp.]MCC7097789.1 hypothetical protein [Thermomonas sp.]